MSQWWKNTLLPAVPEAGWRYDHPHGWWWRGMRPTLPMKALVARWQQRNHFRKVDHYQALYIQRFHLQTTIMTRMVTKWNTHYYHHHNHPIVRTLLVAVKAWVIVLEHRVKQGQSHQSPNLPSLRWRYPLRCRIPGLNGIGDTMVDVRSSPLYAAIIGYQLWFPLRFF